MLRMVTSVQPFYKRIYENAYALGLVFVWLYLTGVGGNLNDLLRMDQATRAALV